MENQKHIVSPPSSTALTPRGASRVKSNAFGRAALALIPKALCGVAIFIAASAGAAGIDREPRWTHKYDVPRDVAVTYRHVGVAELHELEAHIIGSVRETTLAFAHLQLNTRTGQYLCTVYLTAGLGSTPQAIAHELRHCHGWTHP